VVLETGLPLLNIVVRAKGLFDYATSGVHWLYTILLSLWNIWHGVVEPVVIN
jgi:hypothetical protein